MNWHDNAAEYLQTMSSNATRRAYKHALERFELWYRQTYGEDPEPELMTDQEARDWRAYLTGVKKYAASTVNVRLSALLGAVRFAGGHLEIDYLKQVQPPVDPLTGRQLGRLIRVVERHTWGPVWMPLRNVAMISIMARAGLRVSEVVALDIRDLELRERSGWATIRQGKGMKERRAPLSLQTRKDLRAYLEEKPGDGHGELFLSRSLERLSVRAVQKLVKRATRRAGIEDCTPHTLRHTFATRYLRQGGNIRSLQKILGHANLETTARYLHPTSEEILQSVENL